METTQSVDQKPLLTTSAEVGRVFLIDNDGNRLKVSDAEGGQYKAVLSVTMEDSNGVREEDTPIGDVQLIARETTHIECKYSINESQDSITIDCSINGQLHPELSLNIGPQDNDHHT